MLNWLFRRDDAGEAVSRESQASSRDRQMLQERPNASDAALVDDVRDVILSFLPSHASLALVNSTWHDRVVFSELYRSRMAKHYPRMVKTVEDEWHQRCEREKRNGDDLAQWYAWRTAYLDLQRRIRLRVEDPREMGMVSLSGKQRASRLWASVSSKLSRGSRSGFISAIPPHVERIMMVGLDAAGKTTILYKATKNAGFVCPTIIPRIGMPCEEITNNRLTLGAFDLGGQDKIRPLFRHYFFGVPAVVFVVDSVDRERFVGERESVHYELHWAAGLAETANAIFLILANKQDLPGAATPEELATILDVANLPNQQRWCIQGCCALTDAGLQDGFEWLGKQLDSA